LEEQRCVEMGDILSGEITDMSQDSFVCCDIVLVVLTHDIHTLVLFSKEHHCRPFLELETVNDVLRLVAMSPVREHFPQTTFRSSTDPSDRN